MSDTAPVKYERELPQLLTQLGGVESAIKNLADEEKLPPAIYHLIKLRASQINGCAYCVKMHTREARSDGETNDRLDRLVVWRHAGDFSAAERAALAWTEALTTLDAATDYAPLRAELRAHYEERQIATMTAAIAMINLWNRLQVSKH
ncbi:carboxymuconolactone decarboxylase family protein [Lysobacter sp. TAB13]|uniref:carboxymuconolactone decarboxylase family protein n=1 Tax=Lysobacter sp. TAB13 TaxID=3233065 RepID=UPI003F9DEA12